MSRVSAHSGWTEEKELSEIEAKYKAAFLKREKQISDIRTILSHMPKCERFSLIAEIIKREKEV